MTSSIQDPKNPINFEDLFKIINARINNNEEGSYTAKLAKGDVARLLQKIGEEGVEVVLAGMEYHNNNSIEARQNLIGEICDLYYHSLVLMAKNKIKLEEIYNELHYRNCKK